MIGKNGRNPDRKVPQKSSMSEGSFAEAFLEQPSRIIKDAETFERTLFQYEWELAGQDREQISPAFATTYNYNMSWQLRIRRSGEPDTGKNGLELECELSKRSEPELRARARCYAVRKDSETVCLMNYEVEAGTKLPCSRRCELLGPEDLDSQTTDLPVSKIIVSIEVESLVNTDERCKLAKGLGDMIDESDFSDVTLITEDKRIKAHKAILAARSPAFMEIFKSAVSRHKPSEIVLANSRSEVVTEMLRFIYTGRARNLDKIAPELIELADKYRLDDLKTMCEEKIENEFHVENVTYFLVLSDRWNSVNLKNKAIEFIIQNMEKVLGTCGYESFITADHLQPLVEDLIHAVPLADMKKFFVRFLAVSKILEDQTAQAM